MPSRNQNVIELKLCRPLLFAKLVGLGKESLQCPPAFKYMMFSKESKWHKFLLRGDYSGSILVWRCVDPANNPLGWQNKPKHIPARHCMRA